MSTYGYTCGLIVYLDFFHVQRPLGSTYPNHQRVLLGIRNHQNKTVILAFVGATSSHFQKLHFLWILDQTRALSASKTKLDYLRRQIG